MKNRNRTFLESLETRSLLSAGPGDFHVALMMPAREPARHVMPANHTRVLARVERFERTAERHGPRFAAKAGGDRYIAGLRDIAPGGTEHFSAGTFRFQQVFAAAVGRVRILMISINGGAPGGLDGTAIRSEAGGKQAAPPMKMPTPHEQGPADAAGVAAEAKDVSVPPPAQPVPSVATTAGDEAIVVAVNALPPDVHYVNVPATTDASILADASTYVAPIAGASLKSGAVTLMRASQGGGSTKALSGSMAGMAQLSGEGVRAVLAGAKEGVVAEAAKLARGFFADAAPIEGQFHFQRLGNPIDMLGDAVATFADESTMFGSLAVAALDKTPTHAKAWAVTAAVVAIDAAVLIHWNRRRRRAPAAT